jgi:hypothetical protein
MAGQGSSGERGLRPLSYSFLLSNIIIIATSKYYCLKGG